MEIYLKPIISACYVFPVLAVLFTLPYIIYEYHKYGSILVIRTGVVYTFIFYMLTSYFMTVLPLPPIDSVTPDSACMLLVPFDAVRRVVATVNITLSNPATYINLFKCGDFWQIAFNILLLVPFGVYLRYYFKRKWWQVLIMSFCYSLFFELTQLSGLYGIYPYPYRFFEVDDLICNTLAAKDGYHFGDSFTATVNGKNATVVHNTDGTITLTDISTVTIPSDPVAVKKIDTVKAANATLTCKAGEKPKFTATIPEGEERYEIVYESWSDGTTTIRSDSADSDFTFEAGKTYKYSIAFRLTEKGIADGYDLTGAKLTLNGKESGVSITESGKTAEYGNAVSVDVPKSDSKPDDSKTDDTKKDDSSKDDGKKDDSKTDDTSKDDSKKDDFSKEDTSKGDVKKDDSNLTDKKKDSTVTEKNTNQKDAQTSDKKDDQNSSNSGSGSNSVKTGDPAVWGLWASLFGSSGIAGAVIRRRKRK